MIQFFFEDLPKRAILPSTISWLTHIISSENKKVGKLNYIFCTDEYLLQINQQFLHHNYYTDIITFDYVQGKTISADIFVSLPRISDNATLLNKDLDSEFHRVLAHGILHLCGYKDKTADEIKDMRKKEDYYLSKL